MEFQSILKFSPPIIQGFGSHIYLTLHFGFRIQLERIRDYGGSVRAALTSEPEGSIIPGVSNIYAISGIVSVAVVLVAGPLIISLIIFSRRGNDNSEQGEEGIDEEGIVEQGIAEQGIVEQGIVEEEKAEGDAEENRKSE